MVHVKHKGSGNYECWVEIWNSQKGDWEVVSECKVIDSGEVLLIDEIYTKVKHRRKGYASQIIKKLQIIKTVAPIGILKTDEAEGLWNKFGMEDALGSEDGERFQEIANSRDHSEFNFKIDEAI